MSTVAKDSGDFTPVPAGTHLAICIGVTDLGEQHSDMFQYEGKTIPASDKPQILITWELVSELIEFEGESKPMTTSKFYNLFLSEKAALRQHLESWRSRQFTQEELAGFDVRNVLGKPCMLSVTHDQNGKAKITSVSAPPKGMIVPPQVHPSVSFSLAEFEQKVFDGLSDGIKAIIEKSPEYQVIVGPSEPAGFREEAPGFEDDDLKDLPF